MVVAARRIGVCAGLLGAGLVDPSRAFPSESSWSRHLWRQQEAFGIKRLEALEDTARNGGGEPSSSSNHPKPTAGFEPIEPAHQSLTRRRILHSVAALSLNAQSLLLPSAALASTSAGSSASSITYVNPSEAQVTHRLYMNVRISRQDGTFYVRDDLPDTPENRVFQGRLVVGLFGKVAPTSVERFLSYVDPDSRPLDDNPLPSYGRSYFTALDPATGLLMGGTIPSLQLVDVGGSTAIQYGGRLLPAKLWIEPSDCRTRVSHAQKGLLTHRVLDATPAFGITTRTDTRELDRTHTAFGTLLMDEGDAAAFLSLVQDLPTYSVDRPASMMGDPASENVVDDAAEAIFNAQRSFFRKTAKAFGDTRLDKIYDGKILRRIEVTQVGLA